MHDMKNINLFFPALDCTDIIQGDTKANVVYTEWGAHFDFGCANPFCQVRERYLQVKEVDLVEEKVEGFGAWGAVYECAPKVRKRLYEEGTGVCTERLVTERRTQHSD